VVVVREEVDVCVEEEGLVWFLWRRGEWWVGERAVERSNIEGELGLGVGRWKGGS